MQPTPSMQRYVSHTYAIASPPYTSHCRRRFFGFFFRRERDDMLVLNQKVAAARGTTGSSIFCRVGGSCSSTFANRTTGMCYPAMVVSRAIEDGVMTPEQVIVVFQQERCSRSLRALSPWSASTHPHPGCGLWLTHEITGISFLWYPTISRPTYVNARLPPAPPSLGFSLPYPTSHTLICNAFVTSTWQGLC